EQSECALPAHPELPFVVVRILVLVLLDRYRGIRRRLGEFRIDLVTSGWTSRLRGGRANAADADTADNQQAHQTCSNLHFPAPLTRSAISRACPLSSSLRALPASELRVGVDFKNLVTANCKIDRQGRQTGDVAARPRQTQAAPNGVIRHREHGSG